MASLIPILVCLFFILFSKGDFPSSPEVSVFPVGVCFQPSGILEIIFQVQNLDPVHSFPGENILANVSSQFGNALIVFNQLSPQEIDFVGAKFIQSKHSKVDLDTLEVQLINGSKYFKNSKFSLSKISNWFPDIISKKSRGYTLTLFGSQGVTKSSLTNMINHVCKPCSRSQDFEILALFAESADPTTLQVNHYPFPLCNLNIIDTPGFSQDVKIDEEDIEAIILGNYYSGWRLDDPNKSLKREKNKNTWIIKNQVYL